MPPYNEFIKHLLCCYPNTAHRSTDTDAVVLIALRRPRSTSVQFGSEYKSHHSEEAVNQRCFS